MPGGMMESLEENFKEPIGDRDPQLNYAMAAFYIRHNTGIGLRCFAWGILIIPGPAGNALQRPGARRCVWLHGDVPTCRPGRTSSIS